MLKSVVLSRDVAICFLPFVKSPRNGVPMLTLLSAGRGSALVVTVATAYCVDLRGFVFISKEGEK